MDKVANLPLSQQANELSAAGYALPLLLIVVLNTLTSPLLVWDIFRQPARDALRGR